MHNKYVQLNAYFPWQGLNLSHGTRLNDSTLDHSANTDGFNKQLF